MSVQIFLVRERWGEYSERGERIVKAWSKKDDADDQIIELAKAQKRWNTGVEIIRNFEEMWGTLNAYPKTPQLEKVKKWPAGVRKEQITDEMRAERAATQARNQVLTEAWGETTGVWYCNRNEASRKYLRTVGCSEEETDALIEDGSPRERYFDIKTVDLD